MSGSCLRLRLISLEEMPTLNARTWWIQAVTKLVPVEIEHGGLTIQSDEYSMQSLEPIQAYPDWSSVLDDAMLLCFAEIKHIDPTNTYRTSAKNWGPLRLWRQGLKVVGQARVTPCFNAETCVVGRKGRCPTLTKADRNAQARRREGGGLLRLLRQAAGQRQPLPQMPPTPTTCKAEGWHLETPKIPARIHSQRAPARHQHGRL